MNVYINLSGYNLFSSLNTYTHRRILYRGKEEIHAEEQACKLSSPLLVPRCEINY